MRLLAVAGAGVLLSACGGEVHKPAAPGTPANPMMGKLVDESAQSHRNNEASTSTDTQGPGYQKLLERQTNTPRAQFTPCNLVSPAQARTILGAPIQAPLEAPQGPTCIYRTKTGSNFVTVAVQTLDLARVERQMRGQRRVAVSGRTAYCGVYGQPMLYTKLKDGRVLSIGARCKVAQQFATRAVRELEG